MHHGPKNCETTALSPPHFSTAAPCPDKCPRFLHRTCFLWAPVIWPSRLRTQDARPRVSLFYSPPIPSVDQVHFECLYQVHHPRPRGPSEPHQVDQVHLLKSDLVHPTVKTNAAKGTATSLRPWQLLLHPTRGAATPLRPWQRLFRAPRGAMPLVRPRQLLFFATKGARTLLRPGRLVFYATRGAGDTHCPWWSLFFFPEPP